MLTLFANAKVNLSLEVTGRRDDGYHEIISVLQTISLSDVLSFELADEIKFICHDPILGQMRFFKETILKAANLIQEATHCTKGAVIHLESAAIPRAAGLGSSSAGPAAVIKGLNELWSLGLSLNQLSELASKIGSDTPFFIYGGTALAEGRGEQITPLPPPTPTWLVLLKVEIDPIPDKTTRMYRMLDPSHFTSGSSTQTLATALQNGLPLPFEMLCNTFESVAFNFFEQLREYRQEFLNAGAGKVHLAGAGPTLFTLVPGKIHGEKLANRLKDNGFEVYLARTT